MDWNEMMLSVQLAMTYNIYMLLKPIGTRTPGLRQPKLQNNWKCNTIFSLNNPSEKGFWMALQQSIVFKSRLLLFFKLW